MPAELLDLSAYRLDVDERFPGPELDGSRWFPHFLPHWSTLDDSRTEPELAAGLRLRIDAPTTAWAPEFDPSARLRGRPRAQLGARLSRGASVLVQRAAPESDGTS